MSAKKKMGRSPARKISKKERITLERTITLVDIGESEFYWRDLKFNVGYDRSMAMVRNPEYQMDFNKFLFHWVEKKDYTRGTNIAEKIVEKWGCILEPDAYILNHVRKLEIGIYKDFGIEALTIRDYLDQTCKSEKEFEREISKLTVKKKDYQRFKEEFGKRSVHQVISMSRRHPPVKFSWLGLPEVEKPLDQSILRSQFRGKYLYLRVDLNKRKQDLMKDFELEIDNFKSLFPKDTSRRKETTLEPWYIYDLRHHEGLNFAQIARKLSGIDGDPNIDEKLGSVYKQCRRAYKKALKIMQELDEEFKEKNIII